MNRNSKIRILIHGKEEEEEANVCCVYVIGISGNVSMSINIFFLNGTFDREKPLLVDIFYQNKTIQYSFIENDEWILK